MNSDSSISVSHPYNHMLGWVKKNKIVFLKYTKILFKLIKNKYCLILSSEYWCLEVSHYDFRFSIQITGKICFKLRKRIMQKLVTAKLNMIYSLVGNETIYKKGI